MLQNSSWIVYPKKPRERWTCSSKRRIKLCPEHNCSHWWLHAAGIADIFKEMVQMHCPKSREENVSLYTMFWLIIIIFLNWNAYGGTWTTIKTLIQHNLSQSWYCLLVNLVYSWSNLVVLVKTGLKLTCSFSLASSVGLSCNKGSAILVEIAVCTAVSTLVYTLIFVWQGWKHAQCNKFI